MHCGRRIKRTASNIVSAKVCYTMSNERAANESERKTNRVRGVLPPSPLLKELLPMSSSAQSTRHPRWRLTRIYTVGGGFPGGRYTLPLFTRTGRWS